PLSRGSDILGAYYCWTLPQFADVLLTLLRNAYAAYRGQLYQQTRGVAMGANFATYVANMALCAHEYRFLRTLYCAAFQPHALLPPLPLPPSLALDILLAFQQTYRFADDLLSLDNPFLPHLLSANQLFLGLLPGIYPISLTLTSSGASSHTTPSLPYMNFAITASASTLPGHLLFTLAPYDKRDGPKFRHLPIVRYTLFTSTLPHHSKLNLVINILMTHARFSSTASAFTSAAQDAMRHLHLRGYPRPFLLLALRRFFRLHLHLLPHHPRWSQLQRTLLPS
ncbi:hypothetical protein Agub_g11678, partial [Astrephomene gubernaculifera]